MKDRISVLILACFLFVSCSREIRFVRVDAPLPEHIQAEELKETEYLSVCADSAAAPQLIRVQSNFEESQQLSNQHGISQSYKTVKFAVHEAKKGPKTHIKIQKSTYKPLANTNYAYLSAAPTQKGKIYVGAALLILGAVSVLTGLIVITSSAAAWLIVLGAIAVVLGVAFLVGGSMSTKPVKKKE